MPEDLKRVFGDKDKAVPKIEAYNWKMIDKPGVFMMIGKHELNIDHDYQREKISNDRVLNITRVWSWLACGCLLVALRQDGTFWVFDGQHRKLAADKRSDILELPCLVFEVAGKSDEAQGFLRSNTNRGAVPMYNRFSAMLESNDAQGEAARGVKQMVEARHYRICSYSSPGNINCIGALLTEWQKDKDVANRIWNLCADICKGEPVHNELFRGLCVLERFLCRQSLGSLADYYNSTKLIQVGHEAIVKKIGEVKNLTGKGGEKACGEGIRYILNHSRRTRLIPSLFTEEG